MTIQRLPARIVRTTALSPSAMEVTLALPKPLGFSAGAFVNVFMTDAGERLRRAYSISSSEDLQETITLSIRKGSPGGMSERFWREDIKQIPLEIMGPLGINTVEKITQPRVFLFGFGIGVAVIKGLLHHLLADDTVTEITVVTGSRTEEEILYKAFFETAASKDIRLHTRFVVSRPHDVAYPFQGYVQDHISDFDFRDTSVYLCGTRIACATLKEAIEEKTPEQPPQFLVEAFD